MKRILKSFVSALIAACIGYATVVVPNVSADTNRLGDINGDGYINSADASILINYLSGNCEISRHNAADLNFDGVISMGDYDRLMAYMANTLSLPTYTSAELTVAGMDTFRSYTIYNYDSHSTSSYTLTANVNWLSLEDEVMPMANYEDDRVPASETSVVMLSNGGTGFIIDNHVIATAAHCVYNKDTSSFDSAINVVVKNADCTNVLKTVSAKEAHVCTTYITTPLSNPDEFCKYDYALIYVEEDLSQYGMFDLGIPSDEFMTSNSEVIVSGFPAYVNGVCVWGTRYNATGNIVDIRDYEAAEIENTIIRNHQIQYTTYMSGGQSGGPVYITSTFGSQVRYTAIGINTSGAEPNFFGTRMTTTLLRFYYNNDYIGSTAS
ncbi:MAG: trypsin-like serine protease [Ruminococcus sp.]